jgi:ADP-ribosylglycohydrolase
MNDIRDIIGCGPAIAAIAGVVRGALYGADLFCHEYLEQIEQANGFDLRHQAKAICALIR